MVEIALEIKSLAELFIASCILMQICSVISPSWCAWIVAFLSLVPRLSQHKAMFTYLKQSQTSQCQTISYHFSQSINLPSPNLHLSFVNHDLLCMLQQYNGRHGSSISLFFFVAVSDRWLFYTDHFVQDWDQE